jgi:hypothetical protein
VLGNSEETAVTANDMNALGIDLTALQVANAVKFIEGAVSVKVVRATVTKNGLKAEKLYTAYYLAG